MHHYPDKLLNLTTNPLSFTVLLVLLTVVFHLGLVWRKDPDEVAWKQVDYIWIGAAAAALLYLTAKTDKWAADYHRQACVPLVETAYQLLRDHLEAVS